MRSVSWPPARSGFPPHWSASPAWPRLRPPARRHPPSRPSRGRRVARALPLRGYDAALPAVDRWQYSFDAGVTPLDDASDPGYTNGFDAALLIEGLINGDDYSVVVRGVSEGLDANDPADDEFGAWSAAGTGTPFLPVGAPGTPTVVVGNGTLDVSWTAPTQPGTFDVAGYDVMAYVDTGDNGGPVDLCTTTGALTCSAKVTPGWKYTVLVSAYDADDNWGYESEASAQVTVPALTVPATVPTKSADLTLPAGATSTVAAGKTITVNGSGYQPGSTVTLAIYSTPQVLTTVVADASGNFTVTVTVPAGLAAGDHTLVAAGVDNAGNPRYVNLVVTVSASGAATGAKLAATGADVTVPAIAGLSVLALGGGLIVAARRRNAA
ncbi:LPXTG cell wall anchor domain-containing protein [Blastococcus brunescens]|uniref:LPXTG cell wall anchor domain-containing protein n=1 Tax=Blastococcus brunescens TaxID=1564165 RepID=A0ABZ1B551_9ACTN|nr:LPXTG cell wall anchor domain-containing protein [Blastococcus sp. BMG 8361]WRL64150.1 LPXTG cell wall anchor domain-containing protein [Blastococcus sp. BMG 8361]